MTRGRYPDPTRRNDIPKPTTVSPMRYVVGDRVIVRHMDYQGQLGTIDGASQGDGRPVYMVRLDVPHEITDSANPIIQRRVALYDSELI